MSAVLTSIAGAALGAFSHFLTLIPQGSIGGISIPATLEERMTDLVNVTDHPVEAGAEISDHAYYRPAELTMHCGWSNASSLNLQNAISSIFSSGGSSVLSNLFPGLTVPSSGGGMSVSDFVSGVYAQLLSLQQSLVPFTVVTSIRQYTNMMMTSLAVARDQKTSQALMVTATMRQVIIVNTVATTLAAISNQANAPSTAETISQGTVLLDNSTSPAPGGSPGAASWMGF